ncbi:MAG: hypothetical protein RSC48_07195, partial [Anaerorhabdus sp.]
LTEYISYVEQASIIINGTVEDNILFGDYWDQVDTNNKNKIIEVINCSILNNDNLLYKRDYDLGDICTIKVRSIDKIVTMRITEIQEVFENGEIKILPKFGDDYITISKFIEREASR